MVAPLMPAQSTGRPRLDDRQMLNAMLWILHSGTPWRDLPARYGCWQSVYARFKRWQEQGLFARLVAALHLRLDEKGLIEAGTWMVDATYVRTARPATGARKKGGPKDEAPDHGLGRGRGGLSSKVHVLCDGKGLPLAAEVLAGPAHEAKLERVQSLLSRVPRLRQRAHRLLADRGYDTPAVRGLRAVIPEKRLPQGHKRRRRGRPPSCPPALYARRNAVERCIGWLKEHRRLATRYEKLAVRFEAMLQLAFIKRLLKEDFSNTP